MSYTDQDCLLAPTIGKKNTGIPRFFSVYPRLFNTLKFVLYVLLTMNIGLLLRHSALNEALESLGWVLLPILFE